MPFLAVDVRKSDFPVKAGDRVTYQDLPEGDRLSRSLHAKGFRPPSLRLR
jgi:hypothetical protein